MNATVWLVSLVMLVLFVSGMLFSMAASTGYDHAHGRIGFFEDEQTYAELRQNFTQQPAERGLVVDALSTPFKAVGTAGLYVGYHHEHAGALARRLVPLATYSMAAGYIYWRVSE